jgi:hypothetical protein
MIAPTRTNALDRFLDPVADCLTPEVAERIANLRLDPEMQAQIDDLADKANEGRLTPEERARYEEIVEGLDLFAIMKAMARLALRRHGT